MSQLDDKIREIEKYASSEGSYWARLLEVCHGDVRSAAMLDLAHDGDTWWPDMRRRPFAGDEELKMLYREMAQAQTRLRQAIMKKLWGDR